MPDEPVQSVAFQSPAPTPEPIKDPWISRGVVFFLGLVGLSVAIGSVLKGNLGDAAISLGGTAIGGLSALLAKAH